MYKTLILIITISFFHACGKMQTGKKDDLKRLSERAFSELEMSESVNPICKAIELKSNSGAMTRSFTFKVYRKDTCINKEYSTIVTARATRSSGIYKFIEPTPVITTNELQRFYNASHADGPLFDDIIIDKSDKFIVLCEIANNGGTPTNTFSLSNTQERQFRFERSGEYVKVTANDYIKGEKYPFESESFIINDTDTSLPPGFVRVREELSVCNDENHTMNILRSTFQ